MTRVIVCGGRDYADRAFAYAALDRFHAEHLISCVIQGGASGADRFAYEWANSRGIEVINEPADWEAHGRAAGPIRNQRMINQYLPNAVIAFPGGRGTADMVTRAKAARIPVYRPVEAPQEVP